MNQRVLNEIRRQHQEEHAALVEALQRTVAVADDVDPRPAWLALERRVSRHLELEEESVFPLMELTRPEEVELLREDHERIRALVHELGLGCELYAVRERIGEPLSQLLTEHAEREDWVLYRHLDEAAPEDRGQRLLGLFVNMVRAELHGGQPVSSPPGH